MQGSDIISYSRLLAAEPSGQPRFSDADILTMYNVASYDLISYLRYPEAMMRVNMQTQEYPLPPYLEVLTVYLNGQPIVPTTLGRLEGVSLTFYDNTALNNVPQWTTVTPQNYPVSTADVGYPSPAGQGPYAIYGRPVYYLRGDYIGVVPAPASGTTLTVRLIPIPDDITDGSQLLMWPKQMKRALCLNIRAQMYEADDNIEFAEKTRERYMQEVKLRASDIRRRQVNLDTSPQFTTYRTYFAPAVPNTSGNRGGIITFP